MFRVFFFILFSTSDLKNANITRLVQLYKIISQFLSVLRGVDKPHHKAHGPWVSPSLAQRAETRLKPKIVWALIGLKFKAHGLP